MHTLPALNLAPAVLLLIPSFTEGTAGSTKSGFEEQNFRLSKKSDISKNPCDQ